MWLVSRLLGIFALASVYASPAVAQVHESDSAVRFYLQFQYTSDPTIPPMPVNEDVCANAGFEANLSVEGPLSTYRLSPLFGVVGAERFNAGYMHGCILVDDLTFAPFGAMVPIYWQVWLDDFGAFELSGYCLPSSNSIPVDGVVLGGCVMDIAQGPDWLLGGNAVEGGVLFNPLGVPGFELSSSYLTMHLFADLGWYQAWQQPEG